MGRPRSSISAAPNMSQFSNNTIRFRRIFRPLARVLLQYRGKLFKAFPESRQGCLPIWSYSCGDECAAQDKRVERGLHSVWAGWVPSSGDCDKLMLQPQHSILFQTPFASESDAGVIYKLWCDDAREAENHMKYQLSILGNCSMTLGIYGLAYGLFT